MKAITIWQPWASLIANGTKKYETRCWKTDYRGSIAIHSACKCDNKVLRIIKNIIPDIQMADKNKLFEINTLSILNTLNAALNRELPFGKIVATADLVDCIRIDKEFVSSLSETEKLLGDYSIGRYAWKLENVNMLDKPIPAKGQQRIWNWEG